MVTERSILHRFINLNKKPEDIKVEEVVAPLLKIEVDAPVSEVVKKCSITASYVSAYSTRTNSWAG